MKTLLATVLAVSSVSTAVAKDHPGPKLSKEIQAMYCMVGTWKSQRGVAVMAGEKRKVEASMSCAPTAGRAATRRGR